LEGLLEIVGLEVMALVHIWRAGGREFQIVRAITLKLQAPNEVWTYGRLVFDVLFYAGGI